MIGEIVVVDSEVNFSLMKEVYAIAKATSFQGRVLTRKLCFLQRFRSRNSWIGRGRNKRAQLNTMILVLGCPSVWVTIYIYIYIYI